MKESKKLARLGVNVDHVATIRNLRGTPYPDVLAAAESAVRGGAEQITVHLREDRRHIRDADVTLLRKKLKKAELNLEMAFTAEMLRIAKKVKPDWVCLVPEKRTEVTTEGGLNVKRIFTKLKKETALLQKSKIKVSLFIEPSLEAVELAAKSGADAVEIHTGRYCLATQGAFGKSSKSRAKKELVRIQLAAEKAIELGIRAHAGHGFDLENVRPVAALQRKDGRGQLIEEYNIGHFLIAQSVFVGLEVATRQLMAAIRAP
jgi:pyridoxine 5-phosphate synthase